MIYLLDTNAISDLMINNLEMQRHVAEHIVAGDTLGLCRPIYFELLRGILWQNSLSKRRILNRHISEIFKWIELEDSDWEQAARFWADARRNGKQLGDPDLLLAALAYRLNAI